MRRLYFIAENLQTLLRAKQEFNNLNIQSVNVHVWGRNRQEIMDNDLNPMPPVDQSDLIHSGEQGALMGCCAGFVLGLVLIVLEPFGMSLGFGTLFLSTVFVTMFGSWVGGLVGIGSDNYQLEPFHQRIDEGQYVLQLDADQQKTDTVISRLKASVPKLKFAGENYGWNNPLRGSFVKHLSNGHYNNR